eukprot:gene14851-17034_t
MSPSVTYGSFLAKSSTCALVPLKSNNPSSISDVENLDNMVVRGSDGLQLPGYFKRVICSFAHARLSKLTSRTHNALEHLQYCAMEVQSITLGDALKKLSNNVQTELQNTLFLMRNQDPELRTTELRAFLSRTRTKLSQIYAMLRWLSSPGISQCFRSISDFNGQLQSMEGEMARNLDEMYFCHASIFSMRSRPLEIIKAKDILARETYYNLPAAMFSCGKPDFPAELDAVAVSRDLTVYLRTKLSLEAITDLPFPVTIKIEEGLLTLECSHYFRLFLTLKALHETAEWMVLNCLLLSDAATGAPTVVSFDKDRMTLEKKLVASLRGMAVLDSPVVTEEENAATETKSDVIPVVRNVLKELVLECRHTAVRGSVRLLHQQLASSPQCMSYFKECSQAALIENTDTLGSLSFNANNKAKNSLTNSESHDLSVKVWKSSFHGEAQFEVRVSPQPSTIMDVTHKDINISIHTTLTYRAPTLVFSSSSRLFPIPGVDSHLVGEKYISEGCDAGRLVRDVLHLLVEQKLNILLRRMEYTMSKLSADSTKDISISRSATGVCLHHAKCQSVLQVQVDARNGKYLVDATSLGDVADAERKVIELFSTEINNLDAENYISNLLLKEGVSSSSRNGNTSSTVEPNPFAEIRLDVPLITTFDEVIALFDLTVYSELIHTAVPGVQGQHHQSTKLLPVLGRLRSRGLVYNLLSYDDIGVNATNNDNTNSSSANPNNTTAAYAALFPNSHLSLDKTTLSTTISTTTSTTTKRNINKKRVFSEAAFNTSIPGDFVSAAALQAELSADKKVALPPVRQSKEAIVLYLVVSIDVNKQAALSRVLCRCKVSTTAGVVDPASSVPTVLHQHKLTLEANNTAASSATVNAFVEETRQWAKELVRTPLSFSDFDFASASETAKTDLLVHGDGGLSVIYTDASSTALSVLGVSTGVDVSRISSKKRDTWKGVINSLSGHFCEPVELQELHNIAQPSANNAYTGTVYSLALSLLPSGAAESDGVTLVCTHASLDSFTHIQQASADSAATKVFTTHFAESLFRQWSLPVPTVSAVKVEILKRVKFVRDVFWVLQSLTNPPRGNNNIHKANADGNNDGEAMEVEEESHETAKENNADYQLQPLHFTIEPKPSTGS